MLFRSLATGETEARPCLPRFVMAGLPRRHRHAEPPRCGRSREVVAEQCTQARCVVPESAIRAIPTWLVPSSVAGPIHGLGLLGLKVVCAGSRHTVTGPESGGADGSGALASSATPSPSRLNGRAVSRACADGSDGGHHLPLPKRAERSAGCGSPDPWEPQPERLVRRQRPEGRRDTIGRA